MIDFNLQGIEDVTNSGEYQLLLAKRYSELKKRKFKKHVEINISYTSKCQIRSDYLAIQCEYENENNEIITASVPYFDKRPDDVSENELPDIYFSMSSNNIVIFTKHFSTLNIGLVEAKKILLPAIVCLIIFACIRSSPLVLIADVYFVKRDDNAINIDIFVLNKKREVDIRRENDKKYPYQRREILLQLPKNMKNESKFSYYISYKVVYYLLFISFLSYFFYVISSCIRLLFIQKAYKYHACII